MKRGNREGEHGTWEMERGKWNPFSNFQPPPSILHAPFVIAIVVLVLGVYATVTIGRSPYLGVLRSMNDVVYWVEPASPGAVAGIRVGDRLTHIDGAPVDAAESLFGVKEAGDLLSFSLLRGETAHTVDVTLAAPPLKVRVRRLSYLAIALTFWLIGVFVFSRKPHATRPRLFFALCVTTATALAVLGLAEIQVDWAVRLMNACVLLLAAVFVHFHTEFPRAKRGRTRGLLLFGLYLVSLSVATLYLVLGPQRLEPFPWLGRGIRLYFAGALLLGLLLLLHTYRTTDYGPVRRRVRLVLFGTTVALLPVVSLSLLPDAWRGHPVLPDEIVLLSLVAIPLAYGYSIVRHNLMGIDLVINLTVVYVTLSSLLVLVYLATVTVISYATGDLLPHQPVVGAAASLVVAAAILPLRTRVQSSVDRLFYRTAYDYQAVVGEVSERLSRTLYADNLEDLLVWQISQAMGLRGAALLLAEENGDLVMREVTGFDSLDLGNLRLQAGGDLAQYLVQVKAPVDGDALPSSTFLLPASIIRLWVPLVLGEELLGVLLLGPKYTDEFFSREDHKILATLAHQAALAAKNLQLVDELRQNMAEIEADKEMLREMNRQVVQSREAERKKLSWELHDQVVQMMIGLKLQVEKSRNRAAEQSLRTQLNDVAQGLQWLIDEVRRICADLRPAEIDKHGLMAALHAYIDEFETQSGLRVRRAFRRDEVGLPAEWELSLYRVVQEALQNVWRHAEAQSVAVELAVDGRYLTLVISDDGQGFALPLRLGDMTHQQHFGLAGMHERVEAMGGTLDIDTHPGQGTAIQVTVPVCQVAVVGDTADKPIVEPSTTNGQPLTANR